MRVKNIFVNNIEYFIDVLLRELIKNEISYVKVDNEIHFDGYIYRFYEGKDINPNLLEEPFRQKEKIFISMEELDDIDISKKKSYSFNKKLIKMQNRNINKLINTSKKR